MTKKTKGGTLSTIGLSDKKARPPKEKNLIKKMKVLLEAHRLRMSDHANRRMKERNILYYEVLQALASGKHDAKRDRFNEEFNSWDYSIKGKTIDGRELRIGIAFEVVPASKEVILVLTVIDPKV